MTKVKASTTKEVIKNSRKSSSSSAAKPSLLTTPVSPEVPLSPESISNIWVKRRYDWKEKDAKYCLMEYGFTPPADDEESYILLSDFSNEIVEDIENENTNNMKKKIVDDADVIINGTHWFKAFCEKNKTITLFDDCDSEEHVYSFSGLKWDVTTLDGKTYLKRNEDEDYV